MTDSLTGCIGCYGNPISPNSCADCPDVKLCKKSTFEKQYIQKKKCIAIEHTKIPCILAVEYYTDLDLVQNLNTLLENPREWKEL